MDEKELSALLKEGEGYRIEYKENASSLDKELTAFANSSGGTILIGVDDKGNVKGINLTNSLKSQIQDTANNCDPKIEISLEQAGNILAIRVPEGSDKPYRCSTGFYRRIGPNSQKLSRDEILDYFKTEGKVRFDEMIEPRFKYPEDFDAGKFRRFLELAGLSNTKDTEKLLINLGVAEKQRTIIRYKNACVLFFAKDPQQYIPWSVYTVALFKDDAGTDVIDRKEITGSLFEIVEEVMKFVKLYSKVAYRFTGSPQRENIYEYPFDAIREAVINSVMHRYYFERGHNNILRFLPDRIRIENYWIEPQKFVLGKTVYRRNPTIADLFSKIKYGEKMGTGFERIKEMCIKENAPYPEIDYAQNFFHVTFKQSNEYLKATENTQKIPRKYPENTLEGISPLDRKILDEIAENPYTTRQEIAKKTNQSPETIKKHLATLQKNKTIKRIGPDKGGRWEVRK